ncbi:MAG: hypothetical protein WAQ98_08365 [Blastocatellia bacterium]
MIKTVGNKERRIATRGLKENKVSSGLVGKALGANHLGESGANPHNLALPMPVVERLSIDKEEKSVELLAIQAN